MTNKQFADRAAEDRLRSASLDFIQRFAHEINNPLTLMLFNLQEMRRFCKASKDNAISLSMVDETIEAAERIEQVVRSLVRSVKAPATRSQAIAHDGDGPVEDFVVSQVPAVTRVLVVDDEAKLLRAIGRILARDHLVRCCRSVPEALEYLSRETYDVILSDVVMPEVSGIEFREQVVALDPRYSSRFLFMTGGTLAHAKPLAADVVHKPFTKTVIRDAIREVLRRATD